MFLVLEFLIYIYTYIYIYREREIRSILLYNNNIDVQSISNIAKTKNNSRYGLFMTGSKYETKLTCCYFLTQLRVLHIHGH